MFKYILYINILRRHWADQPGMRQAKTIIGELDLKWYKYTRKLKRNYLRMLTGFLTGNCQLRGHLKKLCIEDNGMCRFRDEEEETPIHLLTYCGPMFHKRKECFSRY